jgi:hypothetical protein
MADPAKPKPKLVVPPHDAKLVWLMASRTRSVPAAGDAAAEEVEETLCYAGDPSSKTGFFPQLVRGLPASCALPPAALLSFF